MDSSIVCVICREGVDDGSDPFIYAGCCTSAYYHQSCLQPYLATKKYCPICQKSWIVKMEKKYITSWGWSCNNNSGNNIIKLYFSKLCMNICDKELFQYLISIILKLTLYFYPLVMGSLLLHNNWNTNDSQIRNYNTFLMVIYQLISISNLAIFVEYDCIYGKQYCSENNTRNQIKLNLPNKIIITFYLSGLLDISLSLFFSGLYWKKQWFTFLGNDIIQQMYIGMYGLMVIYYFVQTKNWYSNFWKNDNKNSIDIQIYAQQMILISIFMIFPSYFQVIKFMNTMPNGHVWKTLGCIIYTINWILWIIVYAICGSYDHIYVVTNNLIYDSNGFIFSRPAYLHKKPFVQRFSWIHRSKHTSEYAYHNYKQHIFCWSTTTNADFLSSTWLASVIFIYFWVYQIIGFGIPNLLLITKYYYLSGITYLGWIGLNWFVMLVFGIIQSCKKYQEITTYNITTLPISIPPDSEVPRIGFNGEEKIPLLT